MAVAFLYQTALVHAFTGDFKIGTDNFYLALLTSSYVPAQVGDEFLSDVSNEVVGTGYTAGGLQLTGMSVTAASGVIKITHDAATWAGSTLTARYAVLYKKGGTANASPLLCWQDAGSNVTSTAGDFAFTPDTDGVVQITIDVAP